MAAPACPFEVDRDRLEKCFAGAVASAAPVRDAALGAVIQGLPALKPDDDGEGPRLGRKMDAEENNTLAFALRGLLDSMVRDAAAANTPLRDYVAKGAKVPSVHRLLDLSLALCATGECEPGVIFAMLEDLVDSCTVDDCEYAFTSFVEANADALSAPAVFPRGQLILLRTCNQLLRRLSKASNPVVIGRILSLLAKVYPLSERSAVNVNGEFNTANTTDIEGDAAAGGEGIPGLDMEFYQTFWGLQPMLNNPPSALKPAAWAQFTAGLRTVLAAFAAQPLTSADADAASVGSALEEGLTAKYLTSPKLFGLQLRDPEFRRGFLIQALVLLQFCRDPNHPSNKDTLRPKQLEELGQLYKAVFVALEGTPPRGAEFAAGVKQALARDLNWANWKRAKCMPNLDQVPEAPEETEEVAVAAGPPVMRKRKRGPGLLDGINVKVRLGSEMLDRLWNLSEDNASALDEDRQHIPTLRSFLKPLIEQCEPGAGVEEEYMLTHNKVFVWKAYRLISKFHCNKFVETDGSSGLEKLLPSLTEADGAEVAPELQNLKVAAKEGGKAPAEAGAAAAAKGGGSGGVGSE